MPSWHRLHRVQYVRQDITGLMSFGPLQELPLFLSNFLCTYIRHMYCYCYCYCSWGLKVQGSDKDIYNVYWKDFSCRNPDYPWTINTQSWPVILNCISKLQIGLIWGFSFIFYVKLQGFPPGALRPYTVAGSYLYCATLGLLVRGQTRVLWGNRFFSPCTRHVSMYLRPGIVIRSFILSFIPSVPRGIIFY